MHDAGCPIAASAIWKVEQGGRRITLDEAMAYAQVFEMPLAELTLPILAVAEGMALRLLEDLRNETKAWVDLQHSMADTLRQLQVSVGLTDDPDKLVAQGRREMSEYLHKIATDLWSEADEAAQRKEADQGKPVARRRPAKGGARDGAN